MSLSLLMSCRYLQRVHTPVGIMQQAGSVKLAGLSGMAPGTSSSRPLPAAPHSRHQTCWLSAAEGLAKALHRWPAASLCGLPSNCCRTQPSASCNSRWCLPTTTGIDLLQAALLQLGRVHESIPNTH